MSLPPPRPTSSNSTPPFLLPPAATPVAEPTASSYLSYPLWKALMQQAVRHRYWLKGAAIAYGILCCCLLGAFAAIAAASLWGLVAAFIFSQGQRWLPAAIPPLDAVVVELTSQWQLRHRWWLLILSGSIGCGLWLKVVGLTQQIIRSDGDLASHLVPTLHQRLTTGLVALTSAALTMFAVGMVLLTLPSSLQNTAETTVLGFIRNLFVQILRWSFAASTIALSYGLVYRSSQKSSARATPVLPGTLLATLVWLAMALGLKHQLGTLADHHWLFSGGSMGIWVLLGLYGCTLGLLLGGQYNKLVNRYLPGRSPQAATQASPPSFDSFRIPQKRHY
ncbi:MAG: hypothetical protein ACFBSG_07125 [Leptolyngbyaceae cyanobacterium]